MKYWMFMAYYKCQVDKARENLLRDLIAQRLISLGSLKAGSALSELVDETDFEKWAAEPDAAVDLQKAKFTFENNFNSLKLDSKIGLVLYREKTTYGTAAKLIAPGVVVPGTLSITNYELFFDADEDDPLYKEQDPKIITE
ncbi:unnamed protein product [Onchocerca ochengi]|uniref:BEACH-type PH domain-containing protein n=1 Tax=Onchocerca ochengi TaxID=42157 RepID=A0A182EEV0_ONCOC|nr:unnamed protein product [Onchocerca ochengi]